MITENIVSLLINVFISMINVIITTVTLFHGNRYSQWLDWCVLTSEL